MLYRMGGAQIDKLECAASELTPELAAAQQELIGLPGMSQLFEPIDVQSVSIVERSVPGGSIFLRPGFNGITLDTLVIFQDDMHAVLAGWSSDLDDVIWGNVESDEFKAFFSLTHELVHVRQYREVGRETFLNEYLADALISDYAEIGLEEEADGLADDARATVRQERQRRTAVVMTSL